MEHLTTLDNTTAFFPKWAIVGYEKTKSYSSENLVTYHTIEGGRLGSGEALTLDTAKGIFSHLQGDIMPYCFKGIVPNNLVYFDFKGELKIIWTTHPHRRQLYFDSNTTIKSGIYPLPKLLFILEGKGLKVFALNRKDNLNSDTEIYNAPFLNTSSDGSVCMGSASIDYENLQYYEDIMEFAEKQFYNSVFNATHHNKLVKGNIINFYDTIYNKTKIDDTWLVKTKKTLKYYYEK